MARALLVLDLDDTLICNKNCRLVKRPGVDAFLTKMAGVYKIVIFSAADSKHVTESVAALPDVISETHSIKDCTRCRQGFIKDVSKLDNVDMKRLVWLDDVRANFRLCPHNGIEIKAFKGDADDRELEKLTPLLLKLSKVDDVTRFLWNGEPKEEQQPGKEAQSKAKDKKKVLARRTRA